MSEQEQGASRMRRLERLRSAWRGKPPSAHEPDYMPFDSETDQRRSDTLDSSDQIRAEAPDDLETRRRADQIEREVKRPPRGRNST